MALEFFFVVFRRSAYRVKIGKNLLRIKLSMRRENLELIKIIFCFKFSEYKNEKSEKVCKVKIKKIM